jgi:hypothetical protein
MPNPSLLMTEDAEHQRRAGAISDVPVDVEHADLTHPWQRASATARGTT